MLKKLIFFIATILLKSKLDNIKKKYDDGDE